MRPFDRYLMLTDKSGRFRAKTQIGLVRKSAVTIGIGLLAALLGSFFFTQQAGGEESCDRYASPKGSNTNTGSLSKPYRTAQKLANSLRYGEVGCLRAGKYTEGDQVLKISNAGVRLKSYPGERAEIEARIYVPKGANNVWIRQLDLDGSGGRKSSKGSTPPSPTVNANNTRWYGNDITNHHTGICLLVGDNDWGIANYTRIANNRIHDCGRLPRTNHDHGIYLNSARDTHIWDNYIFDNADRGIQLYPDAQRTLINDNIIDGNGEGIIFSGANSHASSNNTVHNNIISNSRERWNVESYWGQTRKVGRNNRVKDNCVWGSNPRDSYYNQQGGIEPGAEGFSATSNLVAKPMYHDYEANNLKLQGHSPCSAVFGG